MRRAFTLIEILIVVVILGILAGVVIPTFTDVTGNSRRTAFVNSGKILVAAAQRYHLDRGEYPDCQPGVLPDGFGAYILPMKWERETPIGGNWQAQENWGGVGAMLGVRYQGNDPDHDPAQMQLIDAMIDDGDLSTGGFQELAGRRYFWIIEP